MLLFWLHFVSTTKAANVAQATFTVAGSGGAEIGISGYVRTLNGIIGIDLDFSNVNWSHPDIPADCSVGGLSYHVHNYWLHTSGGSFTQKEGYGMDCSANFTGGHYDPWKACGPASGNDACINNGGCIGSSSIFVNNTEYKCNGNFTDYLNIPYSCEMGDWSGKYGKIIPDNITGKYQTVQQSFWEVGTQILIPPSSAPKYSLVIHCGTGQRMWCALIDRQQQVANNAVLISNQTIETDFTLDNEPGNVVINDEGMTLILGQSASTKCGNYYLKLYSNKFKGLPEGFLSENNAIYNCDISKLGGIYDPTYSCIDNSSSICNGTTLCGVPITYTCDSANEYFDCAAGDIGGRIGLKSGSTTTLDPVSSPLWSYNGRVIVLDCANGSAINNICILPKKINGTEINPTTTEISPTTTEIQPETTEIESTTTKIELTTTEMKPITTETEPGTTTVPITITDGANKINLFFVTVYIIFVVFCIVIL